MVLSACVDGGEDSSEEGSTTGRAHQYTMPAGRVGIRVCDESEANETGAGPSRSPDEAIGCDVGAIHIEGTTRSLRALEGVVQRQG